MTLDSMIPGVLQLDITNYVGKMIDKFPEVITGRAAMPAHNRLIEIKDKKEAKKISKK